MNSRVLLMLLAVMTTGLTQEHKAPEVRSLHVTSDITYRFATTLVHSRVANPVNTSQEIGFKVTLPKSAFITKFSMTIDGIVYDGEIKEKEAANKQYEKAKSKGQSAGRVQQEKTTRDSTVFRVSVNVAAMDKVDFNMTYEELLNRRLGLYSHWINIDPGQVVEDLSVKVKISESRNITTLNVPPLKEESANSIDTGDGNQLAVITWEDTQTALVTYEPTPAQQAEVSEDGLRGQFIVEYDVQRDRDAGEIQVIDGYFVHYIAPAYLEPMPKDVMFILDDSGSMSGQKITQTKEAMYTILDQLQPADRFNLLSFSFSTNFWRTESLAHATEDNIALAKEFVSEMRASGGTNINAAVAGAMEYLHRLVMGSEERRPTMIIFLTDGDPTEGVTDPNIILNNVRSANTHNTALYSLGFGNDVDFSFLQKMSLQNNGLARKIYSDSDADLQLKDFYREVSSPLLSDLNISYVGPSVDEESVTTINRILFEGSEIVLAGRLSGSDNFEAVIKADAAEGEVEMRLTCVLPVIESRFRGDKTTHFTERLWAYLTIKKLLDDMKELTNNTEKENAKSRAMELSLKYSFVTPLTSMVVTKPDRDPEQSEVKDGDDEETRRSGRMSQGPGLPGLTGIAGYPAMPYQPPSRPAGRNRGPAVPMFDPESDPSKTWMCDDGELIPRGRRCDGQVDCADVSDEHYCGVQTDINECGPSPCAHGTCMHTAKGSTCICEAGFTGFFCENDINECQCVAGTCTVNVNGTICICDDGYTGTNCETVNKDTHFVVKMKETRDRFCFDIKAQRREIYQLLYDSVTDIVVNADLESLHRGSAQAAGYNITFFINIFIISGNLTIKVTPWRILIPNLAYYDWKRNESGIFMGHIKVVVVQKKYIEVDFDNGVTLKITRHKFKASRGTYKYLGFYVTDGRGLSRRTHGLIGQFQHKHAKPIAGQDIGNFRKWEISRRGKPVRIVESHMESRRDMQSKKRIQCWRVPNQGDNLLDGSAENYRVRKLGAIELPKRQRRLIERSSKMAVNL